MPKNVDIPILQLTDIDIDGKRVLIRQDLNVPIKGGCIANDARIRASLPTIQYAMERNAKVMLMSHLGRPDEGVHAEEYSLAPVAARLSELLGCTVRLISEYCSKAVEVADGEVVLLENVRFNAGEKDDHEELAKQYAALCDIYVMDAFGTSHRTEASTHGVGFHAPIACAGPLLMRELEALSKAFSDPVRPVVAIVGGSKVSTKLTVLNSLSKIVDQLIVGGGIANTFVSAAGYEVGKSLYEPDLVGEAKSLLSTAQKNKGDIPVPTDVVVADKYSESAFATTKSVHEIDEKDMIFDIGPGSAALYSEILKGAGTIIWNGPMGVFEFDQFGWGTEALANAIASSKAYSVAGGGDTLAAIEKYDVTEQISYISTGGGAFLEFLEGKNLPAVVMLEGRSNDRSNHQICSV